MPQEFYSEEEAEQILRLAAAGSSRGNLSRDEIVRMASELGISPEAVLEAEKQVVQQRTNQDIARAEVEERKKFRKASWVEFWQHLSTYAVTNGVLIAIWALTDAGGYFWPKWPLLGWGIAIASHFFSAISDMASEDSFHKWQIKQRKRQAKLIGAGAQAVAPILDEYVMSGGASRIEAISKVRAGTGLDLLSAKAAVDQYAIDNPGVISQ